MAKEVEIWEIFKKTQSKYLEIIKTLSEIFNTHIPTLLWD